MTYKQCKIDTLNRSVQNGYPGVVLKIIIISSLPRVFVIVVAKIPFLGYLGKIPNFPHFPHFWHFWHFGVFWGILLFSPFSLFSPFCPFLLKLSFLLFWLFPNFCYFGYLGKQVKIVISSSYGEMVKNGVFQVFVEMGDLGEFGKIPKR